VVLVLVLMLVPVLLLLLLVLLVLLLVLLAILLVCRDCTPHAAYIKGIYVQLRTHDTLIYLCLLHIKCLLDGAKVLHAREPVATEVA
jgi:hypothetical protein